VSKKLLRPAEDVSQPSLGRAEARLGLKHACMLDLNSSPQPFSHQACNFRSV